MNLNNFFKNNLFKRQKFESPFKKTEEVNTNNMNIIDPYKSKIQLDFRKLYNLFPIVNKKRGKTNKENNLKGFVYTFNKYANYFGIDTILETSHFIAQIAHESDQWNAYEEYASGDAYDTRTDLGNTPQRDGDGRKYKGRGPIQTTGVSNYKEAGREIAKLPFLNENEKRLFVNDGLLKNPKLLQDPVWGTLAALIYWAKRDLNSLCRPDNEKVVIKRYNKTTGWYNYITTPIEAITRKINGGVNGFEERKKYYKKLKNML